MDAGIIDTQVCAPEIVFVEYELSIPFEANCKSVFSALSELSAAKFAFSVLRNVRSDMKFVSVEIVDMVLV